MSLRVCVNCQNKKSVNETDNRLVTETSCGHVKCMSCLGLEKSGCIACISEKSLESEDDSPLSVVETNLEEAPSAPEDGDDIKISTSPAKKKRLETAHILVTNDEEGKSYFCTVCKKKFTARSQVAYHAYCNGQRKPFQCTDCDKSFATHSHYKYHMRVHRNERMYSCEECGESFFQMSKLQRHRLKHTNERKHACGLCGKLFNNYPALRKHGLTHTEEKPYTCSTCGLKFRDSSNYRKHLTKHNGGGSCACAECGRVVGSARALAAHSRAHRERRAFACPRCPLAFHSNKDMRRHSAVHSDSKPFRCKVCDRRFRRKDNLERHIRNTHPDAAPAAAVECDTSALSIITMLARNEPSNDETEKNILKGLNPLPPLPKEVIERHMRTEEPSQSIVDTSTDNQNADNKLKILEANIARESVIFGPIKQSTEKTNQPENEYVHKIRKANRMLSHKDVHLPPIDESKIIELERKSSTNNLDIGPLSKRARDMDVYKRILYEKVEPQGGAVGGAEEAAKIHWRRKMKLDIVNW